MVINNQLGSLTGLGGVSTHWKLTQNNYYRKGK